MTFLGNDYDIVEINDNASILNYNVKYTPALIINGVIISQGQAMPTTELEEFLNLI